MSIYMILQTESVISVSKGGNMGNLNETPSANRLHIGIYGKTNSGKSSLINAVTKQEEEADGWHLPTEEEAKILHKTFSGSSLDELNETIEGLRNGDPLLDIEKRYVYDHNGSIYAFGFKTSSKFLQAGSTVKYKIRLVCSAHYDAG